MKPNSNHASLSWFRHGGVKAEGKKGEKGNRNWVISGYLSILTSDHLSDHLSVYLSVILCPPDRETTPK